MKCLVGKYKRRNAFDKNGFNKNRFNKNRFNKNRLFTKGEI